METNTNNWNIQFDEPEQTDTEPRARISVSPQDIDERYDANKKLSSRSISGFAKTACQVFGLPENGELKKELETGILKQKTKVRDEAEKQRQEKDFEDEEEKLDEILRIIDQHGGDEGKLPIQELEREYPRARAIIQRNNEYAFTTDDGNVSILDKGREKAKKSQGLEVFEGDPMAEAIEQLEDDPLSYYLDSFSKVHIGDELLKIWELSSALSSVCSDRQIHSWAVGPSGKGKSLTGSTEVFVKKEDGWHIETMRQLSQQYDGQDWKTVGVRGSTQETVETDIEEVLAHRNQRKLVTIETRSGRTIKGTLDHSFLKHSHGEVVPATGEELEEGDYIPVANGHSFTDEDKAQTDLPFTLGMYLAEGYHHSKNRVHITNFDDVARQRVKDELDNIDVEYQVIKNHDISIDVENLHEFRAAKTGSAQKVVPPQVFTADKETKRQVLKGYFAGDGVDTEQPGYVTKSKDLGLGISLLLSEFGIITTHRGKDGGFHRHRITKPESERKFYREIDWVRESGGVFNQEKTTQQYIDRVPVDNNKIRRFLMSNKHSDGSGRNRILNAHNVKETGEIGRSKLKEALEMYDYDTKTPYIRQLEKNLDSDIFFDRIESIDKEDEKNRRRVYDIAAGDTPHFLLANGAIVHNSHIKRRICKFYLPEIAYRQITGISPKALLYECNEEGKDHLNEQVLFFDEVDDLEEVVTLLRSMTDQDEDEITYTTVKDQEIESLQMNADSITVWFTSVDTFSDEQLKNRFILTNPDGSEDLDNRVFDWMQERLHKGQELDKAPKESPVVQRMVMNIRENTPDLTPVVPFHVDWKQKFNRRLYPFFYTLMGLMAKIHHKNRVKQDGKIIVTQGDFKLASLIWSRLIDTTVSQTDKAGISLLRVLPDNEDAALTRREIRLRLDGFSTKKVKDKVEALEETEELSLINTDYDGENYLHWAGKDVDRLTNNKPEIEDLSEETVKDILQKANVEPTEEVMDSINAAPPGVYDTLTGDGEFTSEEEPQPAQNDTKTHELSERERELISILKDYNWDIDLNGVNAMNEDIDAIQIGQQLADRGIITLDGENMARDTAKLAEIEAENPI